ncbi:cellulase family glycosylhydrolase [Aquimarina sp. 2201CG5-10]|uniref:cellulase family glycosylhydrolase n=1 Tax=Aquimarina callyspongiae TaxID=3098150 RepID=UPI002AB3CC42|nr:cellulase family glycosylhydrolase [Aquimarina sp. 2201CG5-10]MDY8134648.1 cellulase family glycosylhydrolase [Aquimarina sp. 2201CG5-10]
MITLIVFGIAQTLSYLSTGADRSSMLHVVVDKAEVYSPKVIWVDTINPGRPIETQTLQDIEKDYLNAWYIKQVAYQTQLDRGIDDYYTTSARKHLRSIIEDNKRKEISIQGTTTDHDISLDFYSADGQLAVITDKNVKEYQSIYQKNQFLLDTKRESNYQVLLLLEDGFWRIRHMTKQKSKKKKDTIKTKPFTTVSGNKIYFDDKEYRVKGINYYPQKTPWDMFGDQFDINAITKDLEIIKNAGLNTIRIFIPYEDFGKAKVLPEKLRKLKQVLDQAEVKGIKVIITLFDFYGDYSVLDWTLTHRHAEQVVSTFKNHKAVLAWDIKNEPDLDFKNRGEEKVLAWLEEMIIQVKKYDPNHLVTIGWSDTKPAVLLKDKVDIVSFHHYRSIDDFETSYTSLKNQTSKPLVLQEFGISSNRGLWSPFGTSEKKQASYYQQFQEIITQYEIHYLFWTLYDFEDIPDKVVGSLPWRKHNQKHFGIIDNKGNKKKAFGMISQ